MTTPSLTATVKTYEDMLNEIKNFKPLRGPELAPGVAGHLHAPSLAFHIHYTNSAEFKRRSVDCLCGAKLDYDGIPVPINQPAPWLYVGLEAFKQHLEDKQFEETLRAVFAAEGKENA